MKNRLYCFLSLIFLLPVGLTACFKSNPKNINNNVGNQKPVFLGHSVFKGTIRMVIDSSYLADSATQVYGRLSIDSSYDQVITVDGDSENAIFTIDSSIYGARVLPSLAYNFPAKGPFYYTTHASGGISYQFQLVGDTLHFTFMHQQYLNTGMFLLSADFAGIRVE